jgi:hypothetical protein
MVLDVYRARLSMHEDLTSVADIAGANSVAAMAFRDVNSAEEILAALSRKPAIVAAALYDKDGRLFAASAARARPRNACRTRSAPKGAVGLRSAARWPVKCDCPATSLASSTSPRICPRSSSAGPRR